MTPSPEKSVVQEAEALREGIKKLTSDVHNTFAAIRADSSAPEFLVAPRIEALVRLEQHRLEAENRSLRSELEAWKRNEREIEECAEAHVNREVQRQLNGKLEAERQRRAQVEQALRTLADRFPSERTLADMERDDLKLCCSLGVNIADVRQARKALEDST